jgi:hypothetical protein
LEIPEVMKKEGVAALEARGASPQGAEAKLSIVE